MRWYLGIFLNLYFCGLADAQDIPTSYNWQSFEPQICAPNPSDTLGLRPVLFPPKFNSRFDDTPPEFLNATALIFVPSRQLEDGMIQAAEIRERIIPSVYHPPVIRDVGPQYVGYLNEDNQLVDKNNNPISHLNTLKPTLPENNWDFENEQSEKILSEQIIKSREPTIDELKQHMNGASNCTVIIFQSYNTGIEKRILKKLSISPFQCHETGGFFTPAPITRIITRKRGVASPDNDKLVMKNKAGDVNVLPLNSHIDWFNRLSPTDDCNWQRYERFTF